MSKVKVIFPSQLRAGDACEHRQHPHHPALTVSSSQSFLKNIFLETEKSPDIHGATVTVGFYTIFNRYMHYVLILLFTEYKINSELKPMAASDLVSSSTVFLVTTATHHAAP